MSIQFCQEVNIDNKGQEFADGVSLSTWGGIAGALVSGMFILRVYASSNTHGRIKAKLQSRVREMKERSTAMREVLQPVIRSGLWRLRGTYDAITIEMPLYIRGKLRTLCRFI